MLQSAINKYLPPTFIALLFIAGCAKQTSPTGGPKDTIPPKLISSNPHREQLNFNDKTITLTFSEAINVNNPKDQLITTPSIGKDYDIKAKRSTVTIELKNDLQPNTTYSLNFRDAVQDITERNPVKNLLLAFSTGNYLDSLSIDGTVVDILKQQEMKDVIVAAQPRNDTFNFLKHPATLFTRTNPKGKFKLDYLKQGDYDLYAFEDKNKNLIVDTRNESYAFLANAISLRNDTSKIILPAVRLDLRPLKLTSARPYNTYFNLKTSKTTVTHKITTSDSTDLSYGYGEDRATVKLYKTANITDSVRINFTAIDSTGTSIDTTLYAKFRTEDVEKEKFQMTIGKTYIIASKGVIHADITFTKPVSTFNLDSIFFIKDSLTRISFTPNDLSWDPIEKKISIDKKVPRDVFFIDPEAPTPKEQPLPSKNELHLHIAAFISIEQDSSAKQIQNIKPLQIADLSEFLYNIKTKHKNIVVQLLDKQLSIIKQINGATTGKFQDLPPGEYIIRVVIDRNNNMRWDAGNYLLNEEPEKIYYIKDPKGSIINNLKANFEIELPTLLITD